MPTLSNGRYERFAQELAKGKARADAYAEAGFKKNAANASRLFHDPVVQARIVELQRGAAERTEITLASITEDIDRIAKAAEGLGGSGGLAVARAAKMDIAKLHGLVVDRQAQATVSLEDLLDGLAGTTGSAKTAH